MTYLVRGSRVPDAVDLSNCKMMRDHGGLGKAGRAAGECERRYRRPRLRRILKSHPTALAMLQQVLPRPEAIIRAMVSRIESEHPRLGDITLFRGCTNRGEQVRLADEKLDLCCSDMVVQLVGSVRWIRARPASSGTDDAQTQQRIINLTAFSFGDAAFPPTH